MDSGKECCFEPSHHGSICSELRERGDSILQQGECSPRDIHQRDQKVHGYSREKIHERQLTQYRPEDVQGLESHKFVPLEPQVFFYTCDVGII